MAYVKKSGSRYQVRKGDNGQLLASYSSKKAAEEKVMMLHKKYDPKPSNRGKRARKRNT